MDNTVAILNEGMVCEDTFDYTDWQINYFERYFLDDFLGRAAEFDKTQPFKQ